MKKKILIVDDDEVIRDLVASFIKLCGYDSMKAPNGQKALELVLIGKPDLIFTDIHMPLMNGFQFLRAVKRMHPDLPVVLITGFSHFRKLFSDKTARADGFIEKPFALEVLDGYMKKFLV